MNITSLAINVSSLELTELAKEALARRMSNPANGVVIGPGDITLNAPSRTYQDFDINAPLPLSVAQVIWQRPHDKISQIKEARAVFGWGLKEAKDYIEHVTERYLTNRG